jgi:hypothetical protein
MKGPFSVAEQAILSRRRSASEMVKVVQKKGENHVGIAGIVHRIDIRTNIRRLSLATHHDEPRRPSVYSCVIRCASSRPAAPLGILLL